MPKKKKHEGKKVDKDAWMVTFSDLVTLMITFFVLLLTMSNLNVSELKKIFQYFPGASKPLMGGEPTDPVPALQQAPNIASPTGKKNWLDEQDMQPFHHLTDWLRQNKLDDDVKVVRKEDSFEIHVDNKILFDPGSVRLKSGFFAFIDEVSAMLTTQEGVRMRIEVTASDPKDLAAQSKYPSLWKLAAKRGEAIVKELLGDSEISGERVSMMGYGRERLVSLGGPYMEKFGQDVAFVFLENDLPNQ